MRSLSIAAKINAIAISTAVLFAVLAGTIQVSSWRNARFLNEVDSSYDLLSRSVVPMIDLAKGLALDISGVQEHLTDISATRGQDGLDGGYKEAEESAAAFRKDIAAARELAPRFGNAELIASLDHVAANFDEFYRHGKELAATYVAGGPAAGNPKMPEFDRTAEVMRDDLAKIVDLTRRVSDEARSKTAGSIATLDASIGLERIVSYVCAGLALVFAISAPLLLLRSVSRPLSAMTRAMAELARGNFEVALPGLGRRDEIGQMAQSVQEFRVKAEEKARREAGEKLEREQRAEAERKATEEREAAEKAAAAERQERAGKDAIHRILDDFESSFVGVIGTVSSAASELEETAHRLTRAADATKQLSVVVASASEEASTNVQSVASATEEMTVSVQEIGRQVQSSSEIAGEAVRQAEETDSRMVELSQAASRIGDVVKLITAIAEQTNLLALNATIEAARAGDAGKGFAVVAQEVKALASQTAKATEEIASQISAMQSATQDSVAAIKTISATIGKISGIASAIAAAVNQQGAATHEIARNVGEAAKGTSEVARNIGEVNRHAGETGNTSAAVLSSSQSLSTEAQRLEHEVEQFLHTIRTGLADRRKNDDPAYAGPERRRDRLHVSARKTA